MSGKLPVSRAFKPTKGRYGFSHQRNRTLTVALIGDTSLSLAVGHQRTLETDDGAVALGAGENKIPRTRCS